MPRVVAREAQRRLREVVRAEGEELAPSSASSSAMSAARGSSIIVPNVNGDLARPSRTPRPATSSTIAFIAASSSRVIASGIMISGWTSTPSFATATRGLEDGAHLHLVDLGVRDREAAAAVAEHRVELVQVLRRACSSLSAGTPIAFDRLLELLLVGRQELVQRRVEQADGHGQAAHLAEDADEVLALERAGASRARAARCSSSSARIISRIAAMRSSSKNMCSVRHRPMPSAPNARAVARVERRVGVGAHLHRRATPSAHDISSPNSPASAAAHGRHRAHEDLPGAAVDRDARRPS